MENHGNKIQKFGYHPACFTEAKSRKFQKIYFGNLNGRDIRNQNPEKILSTRSWFLFLWDFREHHRALFTESKSSWKFCLDFVSRNHARWDSQNTNLQNNLNSTKIDDYGFCFRGPSFGSRNRVLGEVRDNFPTPEPILSRLRLWNY